MTQVYSLGIDPGQTGALAVFVLDGKDYYLNSVIDFDKQHIISILNDIIVFHDYASVCIEAVHSAPGQGVSSTFKFGTNFGWWLGVLEAFGYSYTLVSPQKWQGALFKKHKTNTGHLIGSTKEVSLQVAKELFSRDKDRQGLFERKKDHGRSDAALIGWYGILQLY